MLGSGSGRLAAGSRPTMAACRAGPGRSARAACTGRTKDRSACWRRRLATARPVGSSASRDPRIPRRSIARWCTETLCRRTGEPAADHRRGRSAATSNSASRRRAPQGQGVRLPRKWQRAAGGTSTKARPPLAPRRPLPMQPGHQDSMTARLAMVQRHKP